MDANIKMPGLKHDNNKPSMSLIDPSFLEGLAKVLDFGARKYQPHNWRNGIHVSRIISACYRHLGEINKRNDMDSESYLPAVYHLAAEVMFLAWTLENKKEFDDRYNSSSTAGTLTAKINSPFRSDTGGSSPTYVVTHDSRSGVPSSFNLGEHPA